jgi:Peptidase family M48
MLVKFRSQLRLLRKTFLLAVITGFATWAGAPLACAPIQTDKCTIETPDAIPIVDLDRCRPAPVTRHAQEAVLASLPAEGEVTTVSPAEHNKLLALNALLIPQQRARVYQIKVIDVPQAWTGLVERTVIVISQSALQLLSADELTAIVAHEVAHEYVTNQYAEARRTRNAARLRTLELICDALAVILLEQSGLSADPLAPALKKLADYNGLHFGIFANELDYPTFEERRKVIVRIKRKINRCCQARVERLSPPV